MHVLPVSQNCTCLIACEAKGRLQIIICMPDGHLILMSNYLYISNYISVKVLHVLWHWIDMANVDNPLISVLCSDFISSPCIVIQSEEWGSFP